MHKENMGNGNFVGKKDDVYAKLQDMLSRTSPCDYKQLLQIASEIRDQRNALSNQQIYTLLDAIISSSIGGYGLTGNSAEDDIADVEAVLEIYLEMERTKETAYEREVAEDECRRCRYRSMYRCDQCALSRFW